MTTKIRTLDLLVDNIESDIVWRRSELAVIKAQVNSTMGQAQTTFLRAGIALLYAHWEGFVKRSIEYYLEYVASRNLIHKHLMHNFATNSILSIVKAEDITGLAVEEVVEKCINKYHSLQESSSFIKYRDAVRTKSNLKYAVFSSALKLVDIDESPYILKAAKINELVDYRNDIAHGKFIPVDISYFMEMADIITGLLGTLADQIVESALYEKFIRKG